MRYNAAMSQRTFVIKSIIMIPLMLAGAGTIGLIAGTFVASLLALLLGGLDEKYALAWVGGGVLLGVCIGIVLAVRLAVDVGRKNSPRGFPIESDGAKGT